ncbi:MAG: universal stress protein [Alphaproteobacteria bacterium]
MMKHYRRVLFLVDVTPRRQELARRVLVLAREHGARFGLGHVIDWGSGLDCDDYSPLTPRQLEDQLEGIVRRKLCSVAERIGAPEASVAVSFAGCGRGIADLVRGYQPDLVVVATADNSGLAGQTSLEVPGWNCDVLAMDLPGSDRLAWLRPQWLLDLEQRLGAWLRTASTVRR